MQPIEVLQRHHKQLQNLKQQSSAALESASDEVLLHELGTTLYPTLSGYEVHHPEGSFVCFSSRVVQAYRAYLNTLDQEIEAQYQRAQARLAAINTLLNTEEEPTAITDQFQTQGESHD